MTLLDTSNLQSLLSWAGAITALIGSNLLAEYSRFSRWGWAFYLVSNLLCIGYFAWTGTNSFLVMQIGFLYTTVKGIRKTFTKARTPYSDVDAYPPQEDLQECGPGQ